MYEYVSETCRFKRQLWFCVGDIRLKIRPVNGRKTVLLLSRSICAPRFTSRRGRRAWSCKSEAVKMNEDASATATAAITWTTPTDGRMDGRTNDGRTVELVISRAKLPLRHSLTHSLCLLSSVRSHCMQR